MRKLKYMLAASLDGYIASPDGSVDWIERAERGAKGDDFGLGVFFKGVDTVLMGRKTYEQALTMGAGNPVYPGMKNIIFSRTLPAGQRDGMEFTSEDPAKVIARLKQEPGKDVYLCGGGELARDVIKAKALDEVTVTILPALIGAGLPTFPPEFPETALELIECKQYKGGVVGLTYSVVRR